MSDPEPRAGLTTVQSHLLGEFSQLAGRLVGIEASNALLGLTLDGLPAAILVVDLERRIFVHANRSAARVLGVEAAEIVGRSGIVGFPDLDIERLVAAVVETDGREQRPGTAHFHIDLGEERCLGVAVASLTGAKPARSYLVATIEDVTDRRRAEAEVLQLAQFDALTGLLNRRAHDDRIEALVAGGTRFAMLSVDLDRFKLVNDKFGHLGGDQLLIEVGVRLRALVLPGDWIARIGGDEFIVVLREGDLEARAQEVAEAIVHRLAQPFDLQRGVGYVGASVGVVLHPRDGQAVAQLSENADFALYRAKHMGRSTACFFDAEMDAAATQRRALESELRAAVEENRIALVYQPIVEARTGRVLSVEALARWSHPRLGPLPPKAFIQLAEESGVVDRLGEQLLRAACADARLWPADVRVAVNLSPLQFLSGDLPAIIRGALAESGLAPERLQLEVTEKHVVGDTDQVFDQLRALAETGVRLSLDDFGTGNSSLGYFATLSFDSIKVDKTFVANVVQDRASRAIVKAAVGLGSELGMEIVAEGIETEQQIIDLIRLGCTHLQGHVFGRPLPASAMRSLLGDEHFGFMPESPDLFAFLRDFRGEGAA